MLDFISTLPGILIITALFIALASLIAVRIERRKMEAVLREERDSFSMAQNILNSSPFIMNIWDENIKLISTSPQSVKMFGLENEKQYVEGFRELSPEFQPCGTPSNEKAAAYVKQAFTEGYVQFEWMHQNLDKEPLPAEITLVRFTQHGKAYVAAYTVDLRPVKAAQALTKKMLDNAPYYVEFWDADGNLFDCNQKIIDTLGCKDKADFAQNFYKFSAPIQPCGRTPEELNAIMIDKAMKNKTARSEWTFILPNGRELPADTTWVRITHLGKPMIMVYSHDLTPIKAALGRERELELKLRTQQFNERVQIAEEASQAKTRFLARMSHEIRTPISAVLGISEIELQNPALPQKTKESLSIVHNSANLLLGIVNDVLDLSKIEAGKMELKKEKYEVASMINDVANLHMKFQHDSGIEFKQNVDENLPTHLMGDVLRITQVINNLMSNAFKYTEQGTVKIDWNYSDTQDGMLVITITDTGLGMTDEQLEILQNSEYTRFHESRAVGGTGLGMPIVCNLLDLMGGELAIKSKVGEGTRVMVIIPQKQAENARPIGAEAANRLQMFEGFIHVSDKTAIEPEPMPYGSVLVVDDVEANIHVAKGLLSFYGLKVDTCASGREAIDKVASGEVYDIIFMDSMMPELSGTETMQILRKDGYANPIAVLTANAFIGQEEKFIQAGFDFFLSKPIQTKRLDCVLKRYIRDKQPPEVIEATRQIAGEITGGIENYQNNADLIRRLRIDFARQNKNTYEDIYNAVKEGDEKTAHLLAHSLKGVAMLIHEPVLAQVSEYIEDALRNGETPQKHHLSALKRELSRVLKDIVTIKTETPNNVEILFNKLEPLLETRNAESLNMITELKALPETAVLVNQMEEFDFKSAFVTLQSLKKIFL